MQLSPAQRHQIKQDPTMPKLTDTQTIILTAAVQRTDNIALPLPKGLAGAAAKMAVARMIAHGWLEEVEANLRCGEPLWRETGDGHGTTLIATEAGLEAIGIEPVIVKTLVAIREHTANAATPKPSTQRAGTKQAQIIALLQRPEGATIAEIVAATLWQAHSARGLISGVLKKKLRLVVGSTKEDGRGAVYRIG